MTGRFALIIGNSDYDDQTLAQLKTPDADVHTLALALSDPVIGGFDDVQELVNKDGDTVRRTISKFSSRRNPTTCSCSTSPVTASWIPRVGCS